MKKEKSKKNIQCETAYIPSDYLVEPPNEFFEFNSHQLIVGELIAAKIIENLTENVQTAALIKALQFKVHPYGIKFTTKILTHGACFSSVKYTILKSINVIPETVESEPICPGRDNVSRDLVENDNF